MITNSQNSDVQNNMDSSEYTYSIFFKFWARQKHNKFGWMKCFKDPHQIIGGNSHLYIL